MKKLLLILLCVPLIGFGQQTYVPDDNFEQALINLGYDNILDNYVQTSNINTITHLYIFSMNISDLTGIQDFTALTHLSCEVNQLTSLDLSQNTFLTYLECWSNQLTSLNISNNLSLTTLLCESNLLTNLDVSNNLYLTDLSCLSNQLTSLELSNNLFLKYLECSGNQIANLDLSLNNNLEQLSADGNKLTNLDLSQNYLLTYLGCGNNDLTNLDLRNGNNINTIIWTGNNPGLSCINVDDSLWSANNWTIGSSIDAQQYFSENCNGNPTNRYDIQLNIKLQKIISLLGKETKPKANTPLFYIYDDGTLEKKIIIE